MSEIVLIHDDSKNLSFWREPANYDNMVYLDADGNEATKENAVTVKCLHDDGTSTEFDMAEINELAAEIINKLKNA